MPRPFAEFVATAAAGMAAGALAVVWVAERAVDRLLTERMH